jgi:hypothetical protein
MCYDTPEMPPSLVEVEVIRALTSRIRTLPMQQGSTPIRALIVLNAGAAAVSGRASFAAAFPVRAEIGAQPVTVRDAAGRIVPSRLCESRLSSADGLPPDRLLWTLTLEFAVTDLPARRWRTYAATFGEAAASRSDDSAFWAALEATGLPVGETDCHGGDLSLEGSLDIIGA